MRRFILTGLMVALAVTGCSTLRVYTDYDHQADFSSYTSFDFLAGGRGMNQLMLRRARRAVADQLRAKGLHRAERGADLLVALRGRKHLERQWTSVHLGYGYRWGRWGVGSSTTYVRNVPVGALVVDLVDAGTHELVWRGVARDYLSRDPEEAAAEVAHAVAEMFAAYPPATPASR